MKQIISITELTGKTIETVKLIGCQERAVFIFADDTYAVFGIDFGYDQGEANVMLSTEELSNYDKLAAGLILQIEYDLIQVRKKMEAEQDLVDHDRRLYEKLKRQFEGE